MGTQLHLKTKVDHGILEEEASRLLKTFFIQKLNI
jgi:tRNA(adenine34) deaminase